MLIIDDLHFVRYEVKSYTDWIHRMREARPKTAVLCISRDPTTLDGVNSEVRQLFDIQEFPLEYVCQLYTRKLTRYLPWQRIIAAFEAHLDPRLGYAAGTFPKSGAVNQAGLFDDFADWFKQKIDEFTVERRDERLAQLSTAERNIYAVLLPLGGLQVPVKVEFAERLAGALGAITPLITKGLAQWGKDGLVLTEHPFHIKRTLEFVQAVPQDLESAIKQLLPGDLRDVRFPENVLVAYVLREGCTEVKANIETLGQHCELTGVREHLADALRILSEKAAAEYIGPDGSQEATRWYRKLVRTRYPKDEEAFTETLRFAQESWRRELQEAKQRPSKTSNGFRLDTILYEIAYIDFILEDYAHAQAMFHESVQQGLDAITRGAEAEPVSSEWKDGRSAFAHIWVAMLLDCLAGQRYLIKQALHGKTPNDASTAMRENAQRLANIYDCLRRANQAEAEDAAGLYRAALKAVLKGWTCNSETFFRPDEHIYTILLRHQQNALIHTVEIATWPRLFGVTDEPPFTQMTLETEIKGLRELSNRRRVTLPSPYSMRRAQVLAKWTSESDPKLVAEATLENVMLFTAGGQFEYLERVLKVSVCVHRVSLLLIKFIIAHRIMASLLSVRCS